ncbi:hypothetical protein CANINC_002783 [Pichia inconspicua]|uniref:Chromatin modification-related protein EAF1 n=1 Tax=Pichia inconspicua TaxID=52247 RepID=A0A4T0X0E9_9ASCO|nr:hypothetical protein CANINC_002783 [[Candida] inconspicua]
MSAESSSEEIPELRDSTSQPQSQSHSYSMDRIRLESIEKRKQECSQIIKERKRKLSELYCVARLPFVPISLDQVQHIEEKLMAFLEKNDLENGHTFDISYLSKDKIFRKSLSPQHQIHNQNELHKSTTSSPGSPRSNSQSLEPAKKLRKIESPVESSPLLKAPIVDEKVLSKVTKAKSTSPSPVSIDVVDKTSKREDSSDSVTKDNHDVSIKDTETVPVSAKQEEEGEDLKHTETSTEVQNDVVSAHQTTQTQKQPQIEPSGNKPNHDTSFDINDTSILRPVHVMKIPNPNEPPSLSDIIAKYANDLPLKRADAPSARDLPYEDIDIKKLMIALMPEKKPHKVAEARSLTELYYQQQTLQLQKLLLRAHKTLNTQAFETALVEGKVSVLHSRIEELKRKNSWSLRQPRKFVDPFLKSGIKTHWDNLVSEAKWLATDYKEGRRYKLAQCVYIAQAVQDYWTYGNVCCIKRAPIVFLKDTESDEKMDVDQSSRTTENEKSEIDKIVSVDNANEDLQGVETMTVIDDNENLLNNENQTAEKTQGEVSKLDLPRQSTLEPIPQNDDGGFEKTQNLSEGKEMPDLTYPDELTKVPDRYHPFNIYADMDSFTSIEKSVINNIPFYSPFDAREPDHLVEKDLYGHVSAMLPPIDEEPPYEKILFRKIEDSDKRMHKTQNGLFGPYRRINILKPPRPPPISQLNIRIPTIWLPQDDKYLIKYVSEFSFNWDVISAHLSAKPTRSYTSNIERRTPWQCFERYIQLNDKFQFSDMRGMNAIDAKNWLEAAHQAQATTKRRISPLGVGIDSIQRGNKRLRWASMFEAMRKLMKKRESQQKPTPQPRKQNPDLKKSDTPTPEDLAKLKNDRDRALQESYAQQGRNQILNRGRVVTGQQTPTKVEPKLANALASPQQGNRPHDMMTSQSNVAIPTTPGGSQLTPEQVQRFLQMQKQRQIVQQQKAMQGNDHVSSSSINTHPNQKAPQLQMTGFNPQSNTVYNSPGGTNVYPAIAQSQRGSSSLNTSPQPQFNNIRDSSPAVPTPEQVLQNAKLGGSNAGSPTPSANVGRVDSPAGVKNSIKQKFQLSHQQVSSIISQIQAKHPNLEKSQVTQLAGTYISRLQQANQLQYEKQLQQLQQQQQQQKSQNNSPIPRQQGMLSAVNTPPQQSAQTSPSLLSPTPAAVGEKRSINSLTLDQLNQLIKNPKLTDSQRKQILVLRQKQIDAQQRLQLQMQVQTSSQQSQTPGRSDSNRVNTSSITTRFSPQPGSSSSNANLNFFPKNDASHVVNFASASSNGTGQSNSEDAAVADEFTDLRKIDELFGLNPDITDK